MLSILSGLVLLGSGFAGIWYFKPNNGVPHWHTKVPVLDSVIPIMIVGAFAVAVAIIVAGVASFT
jgi:hypothetical protein